MPIKSQSMRRVQAVAGAAAVVVVLLAIPAFAGGTAGGTPKACIANDSISMGKRLAPSPALIRARETSPACLEHSASDSRPADNAAEVQRELDRIDEKLSDLYRDEANPAMPSAAN